MNPAIITKSIKAILPLLGFAGVEIRPDQVDTIIQAGLIIYSALSALEAYFKSRAAKQ